VPEKFGTRLYDRRTRNRRQFSGAGFMGITPCAFLDIYTFPHTFIQRILMLLVESQEDQSSNVTEITFHRTPNGFFDGMAFQDEPKLHQHSSMSLENKDQQQQQQH